MISIKKQEEYSLLRVGGCNLSKVLDAMEDMIAPGTETKDLNDRALEVMRELGDTPALLNYKPLFADKAFPAAICVEINDEIVHGIPNENNKVLKEGDIIGVDCSAVHEGMITDMARTFAVGQVSEEARKLMEVTKEALMRGVAAAEPGNHVGDIGFAIESYVRPQGYAIFETLCGHGVGYAVHEEPNVPNYGAPDTGPELVPGMVLAIEPMLGLGTKEIREDADGYTLRTRDGSLSAHFEHTVLITEDGPEILTKC